MRRVIHPNLMRGHVAQNAAILLVLGLITILACSVVQGVRQLPS
jgi:hypothetical protein